MSTAVMARDQSCRLTDCKEGTQVAHVIPEKEYEWFDGNAMQSYASDLSSETSVNNTGNNMLLRADNLYIYTAHTIDSNGS